MTSRREFSILFKCLEHRVRLCVIEIEQNTYFVTRFLKRIEWTAMSQGETPQF